MLWPFEGRQTRKSPVHPQSQPGGEDSGVDLSLLLNQEGSEFLLALFAQ